MAFLTHIFRALMIEIALIVQSKSHTLWSQGSKLLTHNKKSGSTTTVILLNLILTKNFTGISNLNFKGKRWFFSEFNARKIIWCGRTKNEVWFKVQFFKWTAAKKNTQRVASKIWNGGKLLLREISLKIILNFERWNFDI